MFSKPFTSIKTSIELIEKYAEAKAFDKIAAEIIALHKSSFEAYTLAFELYDKCRELEAKNLNAEDWENRVSPNYILKELAAGVFVYAPKPGQDGANPLHDLCTNCFLDKRKSILQRTRRDYQGAVYQYPNCGTEICDHSDYEDVTV